MDGEYVVDGVKLNFVNGLLVEAEADITTSSITLGDHTLPRDFFIENLVSNMRFVQALCCVRSTVRGFSFGWIAIVGWIIDQLSTNLSTFNTQREIIGASTPQRSDIAERRVTSSDIEKILVQLKALENLEPVDFVIEKIINRLFLSQHGNWTTKLRD